MNNTFIVLLAVCLVSVNAFVKRDAPQETNQNLLRQAQDLAKASLDSIQKAFDPEQIKKQFGQLVDNANKAFDSLKTKKDEPPK